MKIDCELTCRAKRDEDMINIDIRSTIVEYKWVNYRRWKIVMKRMTKSWDLYLLQASVGLAGKEDTLGLEMMWNRTSQNANNSDE